MTMVTLLPTSVREESFAGITYHIDGELVPALTISLGEKDIIYFEQHILLWKNTNIKIFLHTMQNAIRRVFAGIPIFITNAQGPGEISVSRDGVGHIFALHLKAGDTVHVRENQFLAATNNIQYDFQRIQGVSNMLFGGSQFFIDRFHCTEGDGILWLHGYGNVFEKHLDAGEQIDIEPGAWLYKSPNLKIETRMQKLSTVFLAGRYVVMNRFTGPGRVALQSLNLYQPKFMQNPISAIIRAIIILLLLAGLALSQMYLDPPRGGAQVDQNHDSSQATIGLQLPAVPQNINQDHDMVAVTDGNQKVIKPDGEFIVNGESLGHGHWYTETRFAVPVDAWGGIWVGELVKGGLNSTVVKDPNEILTANPQHFEKNY